MNDMWLAGILEGEACFFEGKTTVTVQVGMTDLDVLQSIQKIAGYGNIITKKVPEGRKPQWSWHITRGEDVENLLTRIHPFMHTRRKEKIDSCLKLLRGRNRRKSLPVGVTKRENDSKYIARYNRKHIGRFYTLEEAKEAYETARNQAKNLCS